MGWIKATAAARIRKILAISLSAGLLILLCAEAALHWYDEAPKFSLTKIASMNHEADAVLNPPRAVPHPLPPDDLLATLKTPNNFILHHRVSDIPDSVRTAFAKAAEEDTFSMADPQGVWNASDVLSDPPRPRRRLTTVATSGVFCLVFYEHGGIGESNNVAAFRLSSAGVEPVWHAYLHPGVADPAGLRMAVDENSYGAGFF
jgi:hypothetical protein